MELIFSLDEIELAAKQCIEKAKNATIWAFEGEMGAGKTTFIKALCKAMGCNDLISSPTFSIINEYTTESNSTIYHMDLYRIKNAQEAIDAGVEDYLFSGNICFIEWPNIITHLLPENMVYLSIKTIDRTTRKIIIK